MPIFCRSIKPSTFLPPCRLLPTWDTCTCLHRAPRVQPAACTSLFTAASRTSTSLATCTPRRLVSTDGRSPTTSSSCIRMPSRPPSCHTTRTAAGTGKRKKIHFLRTTSLPLTCCVQLNYFFFHNKFSLFFCDKSLYNKSPMLSFLMLSVICYYIDKL
jgi:hypothetical protein